ncbi:MAG: hypothetical protein ACK55Z_07830, partial [bacterium]
GVRAGSVIAAFPDDVLGVGVALVHHVHHSEQAGTNPFHGFGPQHLALRMARVQRNATLVMLRLNRLLGAHGVVGPVAQVLVQFVSHGATSQTMHPTQTRPTCGT